MIRQAYPHEAPALTDLMRRSKAHWGYSDAFMEAARSELTVSSESIAAGLVYVLEAESNIAGFAYLKPTDDPTEILLSDLFIDPPFIGQGHGKALWKHAAESARALGCRSVVLDADPNALGFYLRMGAIQIGETPSTVMQGRMLPRMRFVLKEITSA